MKMRYSILAALLAACAAPTLAQVTSGATLGGLNYTLFDLDLSDATTPSLVFSVPDGVAPPHTGRAGYTWINYTERVDNRAVLMQHGSNTYNGISQTSSWDGRTGTGTVTLSGRGGTGMDQELMRSLEVSESSLVQAQLTPYSWSDAIYFTLSPGSRVTFTATLDAWAEFDLADTHYGHAEVLGSLAIRNLLNVNNDYASDGRLFYGGTAPGGRPAFDENVLLSVSYENRGAAPVYAYAQIDLSGSAYTIPVSMVPEPSSWALLVAGAALLGWRGARRRTGPSYRRTASCAA